MAYNNPYGGGGPGYPGGGGPGYPGGGGPGYPGSNYQSNYPTQDGMPQAPGYGAPPGGGMPQPGIGFDMNAGGPSYPAAPGYGGGVPPAASYGPPGGAGPGYPAAQGSYGAPSSGYDNSSYGAPNSGYGAPPAGGPGGYGQTGAPSGAYGPPGQQHMGATAGYGAPQQQSAGYPNQPPSSSGQYSQQQGGQGYGGGAPYGQAAGGYVSRDAPMGSSYGGMANAYGVQYQGTLRPYPNFNAEHDVQALRKAMKGMGTDEDAVINVIACRSADQRMQINKIFKTMVGKDLAQELRSELSGHFREVALALMLDPVVYDCESLRGAMEGMGTNEGTLTEILTTRTNSQINAIRDTYKRIYNRDLEKDVISETSGFYRRVMVSCLQGGRNEDQNVNQNLAAQEAQELYSAGEKKWGTDESVFIRVLCLRSTPQLQATFQQYQKIANKSIVKSIESEFSGDICKAMKHLALVHMNRPEYFAKRLRDSMQGMGTKDRTLIRVVVTRAEIDLANVKQEFQRMVGKSLGDWIRGDTSGDYRKILSKLIGE